MEQAIKKAIEGGYQYTGGSFIKNPVKTYIECGFIIQKGQPTSDGWDGGTARHKISNIVFETLLLDPLFWQALGKQQGWNFHCEVCGWEKEKNDNHWYCKQCERMETFNIGWLHHWHSFIDHIANGGDIDDFFNNLLK